MKNIYHVYVYDSFRECLVCELFRLTDRSEAVFFCKLFKKFGITCFYNVEEVVVK